MLFDQRSDMIDVKNENGRTSLSFAVGANGRFLYVEFSCDFFPFPNLIFLLIIVKTDAENLIKYLIGKGADVNAVDNVGDTPLHWCAKIGN